MDADSYRKELIKVTKQRDAALDDVKKKRSELEDMKLQVGKNESATGVKEPGNYISSALSFYNFFENILQFLSLFWLNYWL